MKVLNGILNTLALISCFVLLYLFFPSIADWTRTFTKEVDKSTKQITDNISLDDLDSLKGIGSLVKDGDVSTYAGYTGEEYTFDTTFYPYYGIIDDSYKSIYKQIYANAINRNNNFTPVDDIYKDEVTEIIEAVMYDHPELYWLDNSYSYKYNAKGKCLEINLKFNSINDDFDNNKYLFDSTVDEIVTLANIYGTDYEKEKFVHDKLVNMLTYDSSSSINQSAFSALVNKSSVCAGYSRAFQYIMIKLGIPCYYVTGDSSGDHAWNIVKINDNYYNVDVTWDNTGNNMYAYFNKNDDDFSATHTRSGLSTNLVSCSGESYNVNPYVNSKMKIKGIDNLDDYEREIYAN